ncbi:phospholipase D/nuclease [Hypomontagnella submonticulosa]|nr:phospholipase D/nuclease [Hypomontagnella submonticulosa]
MTSSLVDRTQLMAVLPRDTVLRSCILSAFNSRQCSHRSCTKCKVLVIQRVAYLARPIPTTPTNKMDGLDAFDGDEDAALRYAIALSLQETGHSSSETPIDLDSDDANSKTAVKESGRLPIAREHKDLPPSNDAPLVSQQPASASSSFAGLDRKKMEEERLARLRKRKPVESEPRDEGRRQRPKLDAEPPTKLTTSTSFQSLPYPKGVVKKTWAAGFPRENDIKIEEVLQKEELELALISSFQWDDLWMLSKIDWRRTKLICVAFACDEAQQKEIKGNVPKGPSIRFCFPPMMSTGNMHSKLQLLRYPRYLRIVVPSGNFVPYDWGETGVIENTVFLIDLPLIDDPELRSNNLGPFGEELRYFLRAQGLEESLIHSLAKYDFSEANRYRFIHTIGGSHVGDKWQRTGYCGLGRAVKSLGVDIIGNIEVDFIASSLGSLNTDLLLAIYYAAQGDDGMKEYGMRTAKGKNKGSTQTKLDLGDKFRIYFPSRDSVMQSRGGKDAAGTICTQSKWWDSATFPRELIRDCKSIRPGLLTHSKIMLVRHSQPGKSIPAFAYVGSANLSESAWGRLTKERGTGNPKLTCRNWECGVIIPIMHQASSENGSQSSPGLSDFNDTIPVPIKVPGDAYGTTKSKRPWLFLEN